MSGFKARHPADWMTPDGEGRNRTSVSGSSVRRLDHVGNRPRSARWVSNPSSGAYMAPALPLSYEPTTVMEAHASTTNDTPCRPTPDDGVPGHVWTMTCYSVVKDPGDGHPPAPVLMASDRGRPRCSSLRPVAAHLRTASRDRHYRRHLGNSGWTLTRRHHSLNSSREKPRTAIPGQGLEPRSAASETAVLPGGPSRMNTCYRCARRGSTPARRNAACCISSGGATEPPQAA